MRGRWVISNPVTFEKAGFHAHNSKTHFSLKTLWITANEISDEACQTIFETLKNNTSLVNYRLKMGGNLFGGESAHCIVSALEYNDTLEQLGLPGYSKEIKAKISIQLRVIHEKRKTRECQVQLEITYW